MAQDRAVAYTDGHVTKLRTATRRRKGDRPRGRLEGPPIQNEGIARALDHIADLLEGRKLGADGSNEETCSTR